jgi:hypothetical protein
MNVMLSVLGIAMLVLFRTAVHSKVLGLIEIWLRGKLTIHLAHE